MFQKIVELGSGGAAHRGDHAPAALEVFRCQRTSQTAGCADEQESFICG
jgi:hypothetical protein